MNFETGTPVMNHRDSGYIVDATPVNSNVHLIGGNGLQKVTFDVRVVWSRGDVTTADDLSVGEWMARAAVAKLESADAETVARMVAEAEEKKRRIQDEHARSMRDREDARKAFLADAEKRVPADAKAVIVAELIEDDSDAMSDYFGSKTLRTVILGFSKHTRDLFPEMRKAAARFSETAQLATASKDAEHREKWSMGAGYYLKEGGRYSNGWKVHKLTLYHGLASLPSGEWLPEPTPTPASTSGNVPSAEAHIETHYHTKRGVDVYLVVLSSRVDSEEYRALLASAKARGGWYSRKWGKVPGGFAFTEREAAESFLSDISKTS